LPQSDEKEEGPFKIINTLNKNLNPEYNRRGSTKNLNTLNVKSHVKGSNKILKTLPDRSDMKMFEQIIVVIKNKLNKEENSEKNEIKSLNGLLPFENKLMKNLDCLLLESFDIFQFNTDCNENSIFVLMNYYYHFYNFENLRIPESKFMNLVFNIENNYNRNPYHNSIHAADVSNTVFYILESMELRTISNFSDLETLIFLLSAAVHDVDHPGNTNIFEINTRSLLSLTYNDKSVLENYHLFLFFNFLINDNMNIFSEFDLNENKMIRKIFISNIIATDMMNHNSDLKKMKETFSDANFDPKNQQTKEFLMTQVLHFSDISNGAKPFNIYKNWVDKLFVEFFSQGDREKELGLPISMLCDREKTAIPESQVFFLNFFTIDLVRTFMIPMPKFEKLLEICEENKRLWEELKGKPYLIPVIES
jgi:hypothetical protein